MRGNFQLSNTHICVVALAPGDIVSPLRTKPTNGRRMLCICIVVWLGAHPLAPPLLRLLLPVQHNPEVRDAVCLCVCVCVSVCVRVVGVLCVCVCVCVWLVGVLCVWVGGWVCMRVRVRVVLSPARTRPSRGREHRSITTARLRITPARLFRRCLQRSARYQKA